MADIILDGIHLPGDLVWEDEFEWSVIERSNASFSLGGTPILDENSKTAGRLITLTAKQESRGPIWVTRDIVTALLDKNAMPAHSMTLTLSDSRTFTVRFNGIGVEATPVFHIMPHENVDRYYLKIYLITTA